MKDKKIIKNPTYPDVLIYLFVKYLVFFIIMAFSNHRFETIVVSVSENNYELFVNTIHYVIYILISVLPLIFVFSIPIYFIFRLKKVIYILLLIVLTILSEYFIYVYLYTSQTHININGVYNGIIGILLFVLFFRRYINSLITRSAGAKL